MHEDHRARVKSRFEKQDLDAFEEHQVLEMMLFYSIPRKDTNEIAHRLIKQFGGFAQVMNASVEELEKVEGMGHQSALFLKFIRSTYRYYDICEASKKTQLNTIEDCANFLKAKLNGRKNEEAYLLCLDAKKRLIHCQRISEGDVCSTNISVRKVIDIALSKNAVSVILAHNHPGGFALPSGEDVQVTNMLAKALATVTVYLLDHIVVTDSDYTSMLKSGLYKPEENGIYPEYI